MDKEAKKRYNEYVETVTPTHNLLSQMLRAFLTGGIICTMGQGLRNVFTYFFDMDKVTSSTWVSITLIFISVALTAFGIYPKITKAAINGEWDFFNAAADIGINLIMIIAVPLSMGAMVFAGEVVQIVYERGAFDESATALTGTAFFFYACGLAFMALNEFLVQIYYSLKDMKTPIKCASVGVAVNIVLNLSLVGKMAHGGLALATSIAALVNFALLLVFLARKHREVAILKSKSKVLKICVAAAAAVAAAYGTHCFISAAVFMPRILYLGIAVLAACVIYILLLAVFKIDELKLIKGLISRK